MLLPMVTPIGDVRELERWDNTPFMNSLPHQLVLMSPTGKRRGRGKRSSTKRFRTAFTAQQLLALEDSFRRRRYIERDERAGLARDLNLPDKQIKVWFQNRRMKQKREITHGSAADSSCSSPADSSCATDPMDFTSESKNLPNNQYFDEMGNNWREYPQFRTGMAVQQEDAYVFPKPIGLEQQHSQNYQNEQGSEFGFSLPYGYSNVIQNQKVLCPNGDCVDRFSFQPCMSSTSLEQFSGKTQYQPYSEPLFQNYGAYNAWSYPQGNTYQEIY